MDNIQKSERVIAIILSTLMERGVQKGVTQFKEAEEDPELKPFLSACFYWLVNEGVVSARNVQETDTSFAVSGPALTSLGFAYLGRSIDLGDGVKRLSETVREVSAGHGSYAKAGNFSGGFLAAFIKSFG